MFRPLEPFLIDGNFPIRPGQIRRASLPPVWQWLTRDGAPEAAREFEAALSVARDSGMTGAIEPAVRKFQLAAANAIIKLVTPVPGDDKQRALARVGTPSVIEDLAPIGAVLQAREALETLNGKLPSYLRVFGESQVDFDHRVAQRALAADAPVVAVRAVADHAAADLAMADHPPCAEDGGLR